MSQKIIYLATGCLSVMLGRGGGLILNKKIIYLATGCLSVMLGRGGGDRILNQKIIYLVTGCLSVMLGSALWQLVASFFAWPVSGSHSIVSGLLGFTLVANGKQCACANKGGLPGG